MTNFKNDIVFTLILQLFDPQIFEYAENMQKKKHTDILNVYMFMYAWICV